jgi:hypothetical protein
MRDDTVDGTFLPSEADDRGRAREYLAEIVRNLNQTIPAHLPTVTHVAIVGEARISSFKLDGAELQFAVEHTGDFLNAFFLLKNFEGLYGRIVLAGFRVFGPRLDHGRISIGPPRLHGLKSPAAQASADVGNMSATFSRSTIEELLHETRVQEQQGTTGESEDRSTIEKARRFAARTFLPACLFVALLIVCLQVVWPDRETKRYRQLMDAIEQLNPGDSCSPQFHNEIFIGPSQPELSRSHPPPVDDQASERNDVRVFRSGRAD